MEVKKGDGAVLKIGDRFKDKTTGKIYIIKMETDNGTLFLEGENGLGRRWRVADGRTDDKFGHSVLFR